MTRIDLINTDQSVFIRFISVISVSIKNEQAFSKYTDGIKIHQH